MAAKSIEDRVALLENEIQALRDRPARVTSLEEQMLQFRAEVRVEFSETRAEFRQEIRELGAQMCLLHEESLARIALIKNG